MPGFPRRPLALLICCALAGTQAAHAGGETLPFLSDGSDGDGLYPGPINFSEALFSLAAGDQAPVGLRMERKFDILAPKPKTEASPPLPGTAPAPAPAKNGTSAIFITADQIEGRSEQVTEAEGNVEIRKYGSFLLADKVSYWPLEDEVDALGNVLLQQGEDQIRGPHLRMKLSEQIGFFDQAEYRFKNQTASRFYRPVDLATTVVNVATATGSAPLMLRVPSGYGLPTTVPPSRTTESFGHAQRIDFEGENQARLTGATYSTCKPDDPAWYLRADEVQLDRDRGRGTARDATLVFKELPIFYTPVATFSLDRSRQSGFLTANFAASSRNGFDLTVPYYWNLAPNYDATFYPREMSKRGFQLGMEARYLDYNYNGITRLEYVPNDKVEDRTRYAYNVVHMHNLGGGLSAGVNWNGVSDDRYWVDYSSRLLQTSQVQLPRQVSLNYSPGSWWTANMQLLRYQTLSPDRALRPYFVEPQINFSGRLNNIYKTDFSVVGQFSSFTHPDKTDGKRMVFYPQLTLPFVSPALMMMPKVGLHMTQYSLDRRTAGEPDSISRVLPTFSFDATTFFERNTQVMDKDFIQTLEPRLFYVYIPYKRQDQIPVFDSSLADFNFAQIFGENRYTGYDRINDANQLTAALTTRFLDATTGAERFKAMVGQRYYFRRQEVSIPGETARVDNFSNFLAAFNGLVLPKTYADAAWEYDYRNSQSQRLSLGARYQPDLAKVVSASYRQTRDPFGRGQIEQVDIAAQWPITSRLYAVGRFNYSLRDKIPLETIGGVEYNAGCWAARFVVQRLEALAGSPNTTVFFQLELNDFASIGSNPIQLLRRTIPGYGKTNELPTTGSLLTTY